MAGHGKCNVANCIPLLLSHDNVLQGNEATVKDRIQKNELVNLSYLIKGRGKDLGVKNEAIVKQIVEGVIFLRTKNIRGNLSPENIFFDKTSKTIRIYIAKTSKEGSEFDSPIADWTTADTAEIIFQLGCLLFYIYSRGGHPFGELEYQSRLRRKNLYDLRGCNNQMVTKLVGKMITYNMEERLKDITMLFDHPVTWSIDKTASYYSKIIELISNHQEICNSLDLKLEKASKVPCSALPKNMRNVRVSSILNLFHQMKEKNWDFVTGSISIEGIELWTKCFPDLLPKVYCVLEPYKMFFEEFYIKDINFYFQENSNVNQNTIQPVIIEHLMLSGSYFQEDTIHLENGLSITDGRVANDLVSVIHVPGKNDTYMGTVEEFKRLDHRNVMKVLYVTEDDSFSYVCLEPFHFNLEQFIHNQSTLLNDSLRRSILSQITEGLRHLHSNNIIHGHLSPKEIVVVHHSEEEVVVKIACFMTENEGYSRRDKHRERDREDDIYSLVRLFLFVLGNGKDVREEGNIREIIGELSDFAKDLITAIKDSKAPVSCGAILHHPFFWFSWIFTDFLESVCAFSKENENLSNIIDPSDLNAIEKLNETIQSTDDEEKKEADEFLYIEEFIESVLKTDKPCQQYLQQWKSQYQSIILRTWSKLQKYKDEPVIDAFYHPDDDFPMLLKITDESTYTCGARDTKDSSTNPAGDGNSKAENNGNQLLQERLSLVEKEAISADFPLNPFGTTLLHSFSQDDSNLATVKKLIGLGATVDITNANGNSPLHFAVSCNAKNVCNILIGNGANVNVKTKASLTPLMIAASRGYVEIIELLIEKGADLNILMENNNYTALHLAIINKHIKAAHLLIDDGADINAKGANQETALHLASAGNLVNIIAKLLDNGANVNDKCINGATALHWAVSHGHVRAVEVLINKGADINARDICGRTALEHAVFCSNLELLNFLIEKGATVNTRDIEHNTPLHVAACKNDETLLKMLLPHVQDINTVGKNEMTALHCAALNNARAAAEILLKAPRVNKAAKAIGGLTPLHVAACVNAKEVAELLLSSRANVDELDSSGFTPLCHAARANAVQVIDVLHNWKCPKEIIEKKKKKRTTIKPKKKVHRAGKTNEQPATRKPASPVKEARVTPLHIAAAYGSLEAAQKLIQCNANVEAKDKFSLTPLHYAIIFQKPSTVQLLLQRGSKRSYAKSKELSPPDLMEIIKQVNFQTIILRKPSLNVVMEQTVTVLPQMAAAEDVKNLKDNSTQTDPNYTEAFGTGKLQELAEIPAIGKPPETFCGRKPEKWFHSFSTENENMKELMKAIRDPNKVLQI